MQHNHPSITYAYHFLSEVIIIFLIALPILHHRFFVPYWSYLAIIIIACIVFTIISKLTTSYLWYLLLAPVLFGVFYMLDYPMTFAVLLSILFVWRFINISKEELISRESKYIVITLVLTAIILILVNDVRVMLFPFLQFIILFIGYISSNLAVLKKEERKQFDFKLSFYFTGILVLGAGLFYFVFEVARGIAVNVGQGFLSSIGGLIKGTSNVFSFLEVEKSGWPEQTNEEAKHGDGYWNELAEDFNVLEGVSIFLVIGIIALLLAVVLFFILTIRKKRINNKLHPLERSDSVTYTDLENSSKDKERFIKNNFRNYFKKPSHPIRKLVFQFERKAAKSNKGRKQFETIEDWFKRLEINTDIGSYQRLRYGGQKVSDQEVKKLKEQLKEMEAKLET